MVPGFQQSYPQHLGTKKTLILQVALDTPLRRVFDYLAPTDAASAALQPGIRVCVPFGRRRMIGIVLGVAGASGIDPLKLKAAVQILDVAPVLDWVTLELLRWAADYYHHPVGQVIAAALPTALRSGQAAATLARQWQLSENGRRELDHPGTRRAPRQRALLQWLAERGAAAETAVAAAFPTPILRAVTQRGWVELQDVPPQPAVLEVRSSEVTLTPAQGAVVDFLTTTLGRFSALLLHGVTGSGKTEVYLRVIAAAIGGDGQALVLVPEIALTPQLVERFRARFSAGIVVLHSGLGAAARRDAWRAAHSGEARIVIGTRSAVFTSMPRLALIVVDEEHDTSYKQQEGFRYSARDLAVWRAQRAQLPVILGSATPSLESLENVTQGRYTKLALPHRPGAAREPSMIVVDLRRHASEQGLSQPALQAIERHLAAGGQIIIFLNRRGYAPSLFCNACGWVAPCAHCDARMTLHRRAGKLRCHHCGAVAAVPASCASCSQTLHPIGQGTERIEETLMRLFPAAPLARLDRDTAADRGGMENILERVHTGAARILVGTQMLTKGHHFPEVGLVVILDADQGLFASDFRATERLAQTITQVAGRAGRATRRGEVLIQTQFPEHPLLARLIEDGYEGFAAGALEERRAASWPPYSKLALLRAEAKDDGALQAFLRAAALLGRQFDDTGVKVSGPAPALLARRADHFRAHLLIEASARPALQHFLSRWLPQVESMPGPSSLRWSIDVDPLEMD